MFIERGFYRCLVANEGNIEGKRETRFFPGSASFRCIVKRSIFSRQERRVASGRRKNTGPEEGFASSGRAFPTYNCLGFCWRATNSAASPFPARVSSAIQRDPARSRGLERTGTRRQKRNRARPTDDLRRSISVTLLSWDIATVLTSFPNILCSALFASAANSAFSSTTRLLSSPKPPT